MVHYLTGLLTVILRFLSSDQILRMFRLILWNSLLQADASIPHFDWPTKRQTAFEFGTRLLFSYLYDFKCICIYNCNPSDYFWT